jgi:hypothetical protein
MGLGYGLLPIASRASGFERRKEVRKIITFLVALGLVLALSVIATPAMATVSQPVVVLTGNCACMLGTYDITFNTTTSLTEGVHCVCIEFPAGTTIPATGTAWSNGDITINSIPVFAAEVTVTGTKVCFLAPVDIAAGQVSVMFTANAGILNPCTAGNYKLGVYTCREPDSIPVLSAPYVIAPCYSSYTFVWDSSPTYPGIAEDFVPPFRVCETHAFNLTFEPYLQGCNAPCASPVDIVMSLIAAPQFPCADLDPVAEVTVNLTGPAGTWGGVLTWNECEDDEPLEVTIYDDMPLAANATYTWQGLIHFDTVGEYTICFKAVCPAGDADPCVPPAAPGEETILFERCFGSGGDQCSDTGPGEGYCSVNWTGDVDTVADVKDAITTNPVADTEDATTTSTIEDDDGITVDFEAVPSGACFIATAAYGTPMAEEIQILRKFRDEYLLTNQVGQSLVDVYYTVSPPMADFIAEHPSLKPVVRAGLVPVVAMSTIMVDTTPAEKMAIVGLLVLVSVAVGVWAARRRSRVSEYTRW